MYIEGLTIGEFFKLLEEYKDEDEIVELTKRYFHYRLFSRRTCSNEELEQLELFAKIMISNSEYCKNSKDVIMTDISKLLVLSKNTNKYGEFCKLVSKKVSELNSKQILEFISIILCNCFCCFVISKLDVYIRRYLELDGNIKKLYELVESSVDIFTKKELKYLDKFIYNNNINIALGRITKEFDNEVISSLKLYECFKELQEIKFDKISSNNLILIRDIIDRIKDDKVLEKIYGDKKREIIDLINCVNNNVFNNSNPDIKIKNDIMIGKIILSNNFSDDCMLGIRLINYNLPKLREERIVTIDDPMSPDLDGAFSIQKNDDGYILKVYISDVPVFLRDNRKLCEEVYLRGCSMYVRDYNNRCNINIDMLPQCLSHQYLSLNLNGCKDVIVFTFIIGNDGIVYSGDVGRQNIVVTDKLSPEEAKKIIYSGDDYGLLQNDLRNYRDLCKTVVRKTNDEYLSRLNYNKMSDLIGFPSVLVNYYIGHEALFAIYRGSGVYTTSNNGFYTHSVTPIRRFVSDINLAFFLEQNRVVSFSDKDLYYVQDNILEVIKHLNYRDSLSKIVEKNSNFVRKYIK